MEKRKKFLRWTYKTHKCNVHVHTQGFGHDKLLNLTSGNEYKIAYIKYYNTFLLEKKANKLSNMGWNLIIHLSLFFAAEGVR